jgi:type IV pilus assembly protein PilA
VLVVIFGVLGIYGARQYLASAKTAEGKNTIGAIARGMTMCMEREEPAPSGKPRELPASSPPVPASLSAVQGKKYQSTASDWATPAFTCAKFSMSEPQYFQYEWEKVSAMKGIVHARGDLDGDGKVDVDLALEVTCTAAGGCSHGTLVEVEK